MKLRSLAVGLSLLTAGTIVGISTQQLASADVSSGDRLVLVPIEPCRLVDTRPDDATIGPRSTRLGAADTLTVDAQEAGTKCTGLIPADALSLALNVTALGATEVTFLTIWAGGTRPLASSLNPAPGEPPTPNAVTVDLSVDQDFRVYNNVGSLNLVVDVTGYYAHHNHDDRYYTQAQVDSLATRAFAIESDQTVIGVEGGDFAPAVLANTLDVAVPGPGQLVVTATGNYSAILDQGLHPAAECSLTDTGVFDPDHRSLYETWIEGPLSAGQRSESALTVTRVIDVQESGNVTLEVFCRSGSISRVLAVTRIVAQYVP